MAGACALHISRAAKDTYIRGGTWNSRHFHPATAILPTRLGHDASTARRRRGPTAPQVLEFLRRERNVPAYSRISFRTWAFTGRLAVLPPILGWLTIVADA